MIGFIKGTVEEIWDDCILLDNNGVGYMICVTSALLQKAAYGEKLKVYTYLSVKEDSMTLFGFKSRDELEVYKLLLTVSGVGPKAALGIMSAMSADEFRLAVLTDDSKKLSNAPGIGKKTAQKIILELKDRFDLEDAFGTSYSEEPAGQIVSDAAADTAAALEALGYSAADALRAVKRASAELGTDDSSLLLKQALRYIS